MFSDLGDNLAFYSMEEIEKMWAIWCYYYELLDLLNIEDETSPMAPSPSHNVHPVFQVIYNVLRWL